MPDWMWIVIAAVVVVLGAAMTYRIVQSGGTVKTAAGTLIVNGAKVSKNTPLGEALKYVTRSIGELEDVFYGRFCRLLEDAGADKHYLSEYEDALYMRELIHAIVTSGNGSDSWQQTIQTYIVDAGWRRQDLQDYTEREIWPAMLRSAKRYLDEKYKSSVLQADGTRRQRIVTHHDVITELETGAIKERAVRAVTAYLEYARAVMSNGCKDGN